MKSKKQLLRNWQIYAVLDDRLFADENKLTKKFYDLLESPVDAIQFRFSDVSYVRLGGLVRIMASRARGKGIPVIVNDRPEIALEMGCSGVHLGRADIPARVARKMLGKKAIIGRTIRGAGDLRLISKSDVDYVSLGPIFKTPAKPHLKPRSDKTIEEVIKSSRLPLVAIGGINKDNVGRVTAKGIQTVAFVRYGISQKNTRIKIEQLREAMNHDKNKRSIT